MSQQVPACLRSGAEASAGLGSRMEKVGWYGDIEAPGEMRGWGHT